MRQGRCSNFGKCQAADWWQVISVPDGQDFVCPKCGKELTGDSNASHHKETVEAKPSQETKTLKILIAVAGVIILVLIATLFMGRHGTKPGAVISGKNTILRLAGSNTIGDSLGPALAEAFLKDQGATDVQTHPGANAQEKVVQGVLPGESSPSYITIAAHGSATAFTALADNKCDIGMASRKVKLDEADKLSALGDMASMASEHVLGLDGIAIIVNASNLVDQLDKSQIMRIFTGEITDWSQLGPYHGTITVYARSDNSGTYDTFKSLVLAGKPLVQGGQRIEDSKELSEAVARDPYGIGFIGLPYILSAKPVAVSEKGTLSLLPTRLSVATEDYLLSRRLYLYTPSNPQNRYTRAFVEFSLSKRGQDVVGANGFVAQNVAQVSQAAPAHAPEEYKSLIQNANRLTLDFRFQSGQTVLDNKARADLDRVVSLLADLKITGDRAMLFGFSDQIGNPDMNRALSLARAKAIADEFSKRGLTPSIIRGYGPDLGVAASDTEEGLAKNRRVEVWIKK
jgi:phosphate transport system substrate-binding protein